MEKKKALICSGVALVALTAAITYTIGYSAAMGKFNKVVAEVNERQAMYSKLSEVDQIVRQDYIETLDEDKIKEGISSGYISALDPYLAHYLSSDDYRFYSLKNSEKSAYFGADFIETDDGNLEVVIVDDDSTAAQAGLLKGDIVISVDQKALKDVNYRKDELYFWNTIGTQSMVEVLRDKTQEDGSLTKESIVLTATYKKYQEKTIDYKVLEDNSIGYLKIKDFKSQTAVSFDSAMMELSSFGLEKYIIDLRNCNKGGIEYASEIVDRLLSESTISKIDNSGNKQVLYISNSNELKYPVTVLVNDGTKGAAEIVASAIKDSGKAQVIGQTTNGFGVEERIYPLSDGSAIAMAVSNYVTTNEQIFTKLGITPTRETALSDDKRYNLNRNNLPQSDDDQLQTAIEVLGGKTAAQVAEEKRIEEEQRRQEEEQRNQEENNGEEQQNNEE